MNKKMIIASLIYILAGAILLVLGNVGVMSGNVMRYAMRIFLYITIGQMWNLLSGYAGMTSLGQQTFIGIAGYSVAMATTVYKLHYYAGMAIGVAISVVAALVLSVLLQNMRGMYFAISTLVVAEAFGTFFLSWKYVGRGAGMTVTVVPYPRINTLYSLALVLCMITVAVVYLLLQSKLGLGLMAMRDDVDAAKSLGVNTDRVKMIVYIIAAAFTALAGSIFFINKGTIYPESGFNISWTISMVFIVIIGGVGTMEGPVVGAVVYVLLEEILAHYPGLSNIILGCITIPVILFMPKGIVGSIRYRNR